MPVVGMSTGGNTYLVTNLTALAFRKASVPIGNIIHESGGFIMGKSKRGICMAEGGITQETPEQLMARMSAKYGVPLSPPTTQQTPAKTPAPPPARLRHRV